MKNKAEYTVSDKERGFIDLTKGLAIFLMLYGHCIQYCVAGSDVDFFENVVFKTIYSFHMPLFMLISGYLFFFSFSRYSMGELLIRRVQGLAHPIVFGGFLMFLLTDVVEGLMNGNFLEIFSGNWLNKLTSLWFLWSILAATVMVTVVCKKVHNSFLRTAVLVLSAAVVAVFPKGTMNLYMYPYFLIGFFFAKHKQKLLPLILKLRYLSFVLFPVLMLLYEKKHYIYITGIFSPDYSAVELLAINGYRWLIGLVGSVFVLTVLGLLYEKYTCRVKKPVVSTWLKALGKKSLQVYVLSVPLLSAFLSVGFPLLLKLLRMENVFVQNPLVYNVVFTLSLAVVYAFGLYFAVKLLERLKLSKLLFGR